MDNSRKKILGVPIDAYQPQEFIEKIKHGLQDHKVKTIFAVNAEKIMFARKDPKMFNILQDSDFLLPDGFGPVVGLKLIYGKKIERTTGVGLMFKFLEIAEKDKAKVFIYGAKPEVLEIAKKNIRKKHPSLDLVGSEHGYISEKEYFKFIKQINVSGADILFVALGSPKQEIWIHKYKKLLKVKYCIGVGGSIDVLAGQAQLAPTWISKMYLEWIYRLLKDPSRLKRQKTIPIFIVKMLMEAVKARLN